MYITMLLNDQVEIVVAEAHTYVFNVLPHI